MSLFPGARVIVNRSRPILVGLVVLCVVGLSPSLLPADRPVPKVGTVFERQLEARETQSVIEHWTGKQRMSRRSALTARVRFRLAKLDDRQVVVRGEVLEGHFEFGLRGFLELESVYGLFFDSLIFEMTLTPKGTRLNVDGRSWKRIVAKFDESQRERRLTDAVRLEVVGALRRQLERAQVVSFWPLLRGDDERGGLRSTLGLSLWRKHGKTSGTIRLEPLPDLARFFSNTSGEEIPLRRWHTALGAKRAEPVGIGTLAWIRDSDGLPSGCRLEAFGDYVDRKELEELVERPLDYRQHHELDIWLGPPGVKLPTVAEFTGLPPFLGLPDLYPLLEPGKAQKQFVALMERAAQGGRELKRVIEEYADLERGEKASVRLRAALHFALAEELALAAFGKQRVAVADLEHIVGQWIRGEKALPRFLIALRAVAHPFAKLPDPDRVRLCQVALERADPELARWGSRTLAQGNWKGSAAVLINALRRELDRGANGSAVLIRELRMDLQRLLGPTARALDVPSLTRLAKTRRAHERVRPFTFTERLADPDGITYFEEAMSGPTVLLLDSSVDAFRTSRSRRTKAFKIVPGRLFWARHFIERTLRKLTAKDRFGIVKFHGRASVFAGGLRSADLPTKRGAIEFLARPEIVKPKERAVVRRARYDIGFSSALADPDVETIVLLTDGARGDFWRIEAELLVSNYLRGVRIITYGHDEEIPVVEREPLRFLERLAYMHHGWCRFVQ
jgi:hypothetical protein